MRDFRLHLVNEYSVRLWRLDTRRDIWMVSVLYTVLFGVHFDLDMPASVYLFCVDAPLFNPAS